MRKAFALLLVLCVVNVWGPVSTPAADDQAKKDLKKAEAQLKRALSKGNLDHIAYYLEIVGRNGTPAILKRVLSIGAQYRGDPVRSSVARVLVQADSPAAIEFYGKELLSTKRIEMAILLIEALERIQSEHSVAPLANALGKHKNKKILTEIAIAMRYKPDKRSIDALIKLFKSVVTDQDKLWAETCISLTTLTGFEYQVYEDWANWWIVARDAWEPSKDSKAEAKAISGVYRPRRGRGLELPKIFGQEVPSKRVVFVIDTSDSMNKVHEPASTEAGATGQEQVTRLKRAQDELIGAITALRKDVRFGIIAYNQRSYPFDDAKLQLASPRNKRKAIEFIRGWIAEKTTNTGDAMLAALALPEVDTIILLSDGSPTDPETGTLVDIEPIVEALTSDNRFKRVTIHTLGFQGAKYAFMKALADLNHGTYAHIK